MELELEKIQSYQDSMKTDNAVVKIHSDILVHYKEKFSDHFNPFELDLFVKQIMYDKGEIRFLATSGDPIVNSYLKDQALLYDCICDEDFKTAFKDKYPEFFV